MSIPQYYGATGHLMVKHSDHLKIVDRLKAENETLRQALRDVRNISSDYLSPLALGLIDNTLGDTLDDTTMGNGDQG
ncbi:hypothetical protein [Pseudomonas sp. MONT-RG-20F-20-E-7-02]|uniref:hypothetical protein n=1 Tax=Pseudomonas sp. MONT-RG-20F-20-E-7-02 TaxID=2914979 RepID=UPI001F5AE17D|nr:hypothetical protein [Pseudomonas sp. MONT-RG-20F-20-E-7-02]